MKSFSTAVLEYRLFAAALASTLFLCVGVSVAAAFATGLYLELNTGVLLLATIAIAGFLTARITRLSLLPRFLILLYVLPFSALLGYLFDPNFAWVFSPNGYEIIKDHLVVRQMLAIGTVGLCGLIAGVSAAAFEPTARSTPVVVASRTSTTLGPVVFSGMVAFAVGLSWLSAPAETIFEKAYMTDQVTAAARINFAAASLVSYILLVVLAIDIERDPHVWSRRKKLLALGVGVAYVVLVLQLLRGDRESSGLIVALAGLYLTSPIRSGRVRRASRVVRSRFRKLLVPMLLAVAVYVFLGGARSVLVAGAETLGLKAMLQFGLSQNTWTAVLWTNLGTAWEYRHGLLHYKFGLTYLDYLLSLPPGLITGLFGFVRPLNAATGIVFEDPAGVSAGGLHVVIAPFKNFGMAGAVLVLFAYGWFATKLEILNSRGGVAARLFWASTLCAGFWWFWYGDMPFIRALMIAFITYWLYRIALSLSWSAQFDRPPARSPGPA